MLCDTSVKTGITGIICSVDEERESCAMRRDERLSIGALQGKLRWCMDMNASSLSVKLLSIY